MICSFFYVINFKVVINFLYAILDKLLKKSPTFEHAQKSTELRLRYNHAGMFSYKFLNGVDVLSIVFELRNILGGDIKKNNLYIIL